MPFTDCFSFLLSSVRTLFCSLVQVVLELLEWAESLLGCVVLGFHMSVGFELDLDCPLPILTPNILRTYGVF